jgi:hypothetical protein
LVERLLTQAAKRTPDFQSDGQRDAWVKRTMGTETHPGAAGIAQSLIDDQVVLARLLRSELYRPPSDGAKTLKPSDFSPGPTAHAVAALRVARDRSTQGTVMKILTTNYDGFLERGLQQRSDVTAKILPWYWPEPRKTPPRDRIKVHHLHGYVASTKSNGDIILTDTSYHAHGSAAETRDNLVRNILSNYSCLFLGSSFSDPNIIKYIYEAAGERRARTNDGGPPPDPGSEKPQHVALFTHHSDDPPEVLKVREDVIQSRVSGAFTICVFLDYYADVSQFVYEVTNAVAKSHVRPYHVRARELLRPILRRVIYTGHRSKFDEAQPRLNKRLLSILKTVMQNVDQQCGSALSGEDLALALWLLDESGQKLTPWVTTDRVHRDPRLIQTVDLRPNSRWLAVRAVCEGKWLGEPRSSDESRWRFIAGFPLIAQDDGDGYVIIGAVSVTSQQPHDTTWLGRLNKQGESMMSEEFSARISSWLSSAAKS